MNFKDLTYYVHLIETQSYSQTALDLQVSQPTISQAIKRLEAYFQTPLIIKKNKSSALTLTKSGKVLEGLAKQILAEWQQGQQTITSLKNEVMRVGVATGISERYFAEIAKRLSDLTLLPKIQLVVQGSNELKKELAQGKLDVIVIGQLSGETTKQPHLETILLKEFHFEFIASCDHPLAQKTRVLTLADLSAYPFIVLNAAYLNFGTFQKIFEREANAPTILFESDTMRLVYQLVAQNLGLGFASDIYQFHDPTVTVLTIPELTMPRTVACLQYEKARVQSAYFEQLVEIICEVIR
jgi:DNA-binding transcriptional LysR family regulator